MSMRSLIIPLFILVLSAPLNAAPLLIMGDSLSAAYGMAVEQGWVSLLEARIEEVAPGCRVINASVSGETSSGGVTRLPPLLERHQPEVVVIELGGNDGLRGLPPQRLQQNLAAMIQRSREAGAEVLLVGMQMPPNYGPAYTEAFAAIYPRLAKELQVPLVPFLLEGVAGDNTKMQGDGIHAAPESQPRLLENVWPHLKPLLKACDS